MNEKMIEEILTPYERSVFVRLKGLEYQNEKYSLDEDGLFIQDDFIFIKTIEENFDSPIYVRFRLVLINKNEKINNKNDTKLLKAFTLTNTFGIETFLGNDFTDLSSDDPSIIVPFINTKVSIYVNNIDSPDEIEVYLTNF